VSIRQELKEGNGPVKYCRCREVVWLFASVASVAIATL
jgi:hypothetical protein